jgi:protein gp37
MAETTGIAWCDSTFNAWIGCTKVSPGCDHCYAEALDARHRWGGATHWGTAVPRMRTSEANWRKPLAWNRAREKDGKRHLVFTNSLADVFDNEVPNHYREDLFGLIGSTPSLTWLLLTKRIGNVSKMTPGWNWPNVWLGASIVNQAEADRDIPKLLATPAAVRFVSYEPALGPVNFGDWLILGRWDSVGRELPKRGIDWIIVGGESRQGKYAARPFDLAWARSAVAQCRAAGVPCFVKQLGSTMNLKDRAGADPEEWPADLRIQEFPTRSMVGDG